MAEVKKPRAQITISRIIDIESVTRYYKLQSASAAAPSKPTDGAAIPSGWTKTEPAYQNGATNRLYFVDQTIMTNGGIYYSQVSLSSSYEAAKEAWNKANNAQKTADGIANNIYYPDTVEVDGSKLRAGSVTAKQINVEDLFAHDVEATGTIKGLKITGASGEFSKGFSVNVPYGQSSANMIIQADESKVTIGSKTPDAAGIGCATFEPGIATLNGSQVKMMGKSVTIAGTTGIQLSGAEVSIGDGLSVSNNIMINGSFYRKGNLIGETIVGIKENVSIKKAAWVNTGASITLPPGTYMMVGTINFGSCKAGRLGARFTTGGVSYGQMTNLIPGLSTNAATTSVQVQWIMNVTDTTKYDLQAFQSSTAAVSCSSWIKAVRIA